MKKVIEIEIVGRGGVWWKFEMKGKDGVVRKWIMKEVEEFREEKEVKDMEKLG